MNENGEEWCSMVGTTICVWWGPISSIKVCVWQWRLAVYGMHLSPPYCTFPYHTVWWGKVHTIINQTPLSYTNLYWWDWSPPYKKYLCPPYCTIPHHFRSHTVLHVIVGILYYELNLPYTCKQVQILCQNKVSSIVWTPPSSRMNILPLNGKD